jgi:hypothetical protein
LGPHDELNKWRLLWWMLLGMPIVREMYVFTAIEHPKRLGHNVWLGLGILVIEWSFIFKFGHEEIAKAGCALSIGPARQPGHYQRSLSRALTKPRVTIGGA